MKYCIQGEMTQRITFGYTVDTPTLEEAEQLVKAILMRTNPLPNSDVGWETTYPPTFKNLEVEIYGPD